MDDFNLMLPHVKRLIQYFRFGIFGGKLQEFIDVRVDYTKPHFSLNENEGVQVLKISFKLYCRFLVEFKDNILQSDEKELLFWEKWINIFSPFNRISSVLYLRHFKKYDHNEYKNY